MSPLWFAFPDCSRTLYLQSCEWMWISQPTRCPGRAALPSTPALPPAPWGSRQGKRALTAPRRMRDVSRNNQRGCLCRPASSGEAVVLIDVSVPRFRDSLRRFGKGEASDVAESFHFKLCQTHGSGLTSAKRCRLQSIRPPRSANANDVSGLHSYHPHSDAKFSA